MWQKTAGVRQEGLQESPKKWQSHVWGFAATLATESSPSPSPQLDLVEREVLRTSGQAGLLVVPQARGGTWVKNERGRGP